MELCRNALCDFITLHDQEGKHQLGKWDQEAQPPTSLVVNGKVTLKFHSDPFVHGKGFELHISSEENDKHIGAL